jgi:Mg-chelatase subunit ChlD
MGFLDYAWMISLQKDKKKVKILQDSSLGQPVLLPDNFGFTIKLPNVQFLEGKQIAYLGEKLTLNKMGKAKVGRLFRAAVLHLTTHTLVPLPKEKVAPSDSDSFTEAFAKSIIRDIYVNAHLQAGHPDRFVDIAYANALSFQRIKPVERIFATSTKVMTALLSKINMGLVKGSLETEEEQTVNTLYQDLMTLKETFLASLNGEQINLAELFDEKVKRVTGLLEPFGPFLEAPSLPYTEQIGSCSIYTDAAMPLNSDFESIFAKSLETLGGSVPAVDNIEQCWRPEQEAEALQAFDSERYQKERQEKMLSKISPYATSMRFKSVEFPEEDYTQYLRAKSLVQGASRRLLEALRTALNLLDEDPRQEMGQLDLAAVIQAIASNKPATDVFTMDTHLKQNFAWSIILDASGSMRVRGEYARALAIAVAEAAKELMTDPTSWTFFGFGDRLYILKDSNESYSQRVRARIGGLRFEGLTYMPDAVHVAGKMLAKRFEEQRVLIVISDGWPYGYENMPTTLMANISDLLNKGVIVIGIGVETDRMTNFFKLSTSVYTPKDLVKKLANVFVKASAKALET